MRRTAMLLAAVLSMAASAQQFGELVRPGRETRPPRPVRTVEPEYSQAARAARVQGTIVLRVLVDRTGHPSDVTVLTPLGFGLDERAKAAVRQWMFQPATQYGRQVDSFTVVESKFRLPKTWFDRKKEHRRIAYYLALWDLRHGGARLREKAVATLHDLVRHKFPAAMYTVAKLCREGQLAEPPRPQALELLQQAAVQNYPPAMYEMAKLYVSGSEVPPDPERGFQLLREASVLGNAESQYFLGSRYETGDGVPRDVERARRYFRLCAASGYAVCELRLAKLMLDQPAPADRDYVQALAWLQLAADQGLEDAGKILARELPKLTAEQLEWKQKWEPKLAAKH